MAYLLIDHTVEDYEEWKPRFDDHASTRAESGSEGVQLFHKEGEPNEIVILFEWDSLENAREFAASDDLRDTMEAAGVVGEPDLHFLEKLEDVPE
jgi:heme-degrading monooxygenase HmoA